MTHDLQSAWIVFYNDNPIEEGDSFINLFVKKYEMEDYILANFTERDAPYIKVLRWKVRHYGMSKEHWQKWHNNVDRFSDVINVAKIFEKAKKHVS